MSVFRASAPKILLTAGLIILPAATLVACSQEETTSTTEQAVSLPVDTPRVSVLSLGDSPRSAYTYARSENNNSANADSFTQDLKISTGFNQFTSDAAVDPTAPAGGDVNTLSATVDGKVTDSGAEFTFNDMTYSQLSLNANLATANGFTLGWDADDNGLIRTVHLAAPIGASDEGRSLMETSLMKFISLPVIFPSEEIGVGAQWTVDSKVPGATSTLQTVTYTLSAINPDGTLALDVQVAQRPSVGALDLSTGTETGTETTAAQSANELKVLSSNTTSQGSLTVDPNHPIPTKGIVQFTTRVIYGTDDSPVRVVQDSTTAVNYGD
ncbi:MAG: hypothetical protein Q3972_05245 [Corynebacterium sp.]|nr:hypothetical protein [Corynebacterium sp.]